MFSMSICIYFLFKTMFQFTCDDTVSPKNVSDFHSNFASRKPLITPENRIRYLLASLLLYKILQEPVLEPESRKKTKPAKSESPARTHRSSEPSSGFEGSGDTQSESGVRVWKFGSVAVEKAESIPDKTTQIQVEISI